MELRWPKVSDCLGLFPGDGGRWCGGGDDGWSDTGLCLA